MVGYPAVSQILSYFRNIRLSNRLFKFARFILTIQDMLRSWDRWRTQKQWKRRP